MGYHNTNNMATLKATQEFIKTYKSTFYVYHFDKHTNKRVGAYGGLDLLTAFMEMVNRLHQGYDVIVMDEQGNKVCFKREMQTNVRVHYDFAKQYAISIDAYDLKVKEVQYDS